MSVTRNDSIYDEAENTTTHAAKSSIKALHSKRTTNNLDLLATPCTRASAAHELGISCDFETLRRRNSLFHVRRRVVSEGMVHAGVWS